MRAVPAKPTTGKILGSVSYTTAKQSEQVTEFLSVVSSTTAAPVPYTRIPQGVYVLNMKLRWILDNVQFPLSTNRDYSL